MPEISRFFGIVIRMYANEHDPPHFHAVFGEYRASFEIETGRLTGRFPRDRERLILAWLGIHRAELLECWRRARRGVPPGRIEPLE